MRKILGNYTFAWWQLAILKLALICAGIVVGALFSAFVLGALWLFIALWIVAASYILWQSFRSKDDSAGN